MNDSNAENKVKWSKWNPLSPVSRSFGDTVAYSSKLPRPKVAGIQYRNLIPNPPRVKYPAVVVRSSQIPSGDSIEDDESRNESSYSSENYFVPISNLISQLLAELSQTTELSEEEILKRAVVLFAAAQKAEAEGNHLAVVDGEDNILAEISAIES